MTNMSKKNVQENCHPRVTDMHMTEIQSATNRPYVHENVVPNVDDSILVPIWLFGMMISNTSSHTLNNLANLGLQVLQNR